MPQMAPMMWVSLIISLFFMLFLLMMYMYFLKDFSPNLNKVSIKKKNTKPWKW